MNTKRLVGAAVFVAVMSVIPLAAADDPQVGTWKLNAAKSKSTMFKSGTVQVEPAGDGIKVMVDLVRPDGTPSKWAFTATYDGKEAPVSGDSPFGDALTLTRVDARTAKITVKQAGKVTVNQTITVSEDGKTRTITTKGTNVKGEPVDSMTFYERQ